MLGLLLLNAVLHAAEGSIHTLNEALLDLPVVLLHLQMPKQTSLTHGSLVSTSFCRIHLFLFSTAEIWFALKETCRFSR